MPQHRDQQRFSAQQSQNQSLSFAELLKYPASGQDTGVRYVIAALMALVSFTIMPILFFIGYLWRTAYWRSRGDEAPPRVSGWTSNIAAGFRGLTTGLVVYALPFGTTVYGLWTVSPNSGGLLKTIEMGLGVVAISAGITAFFGTSLFINCAQQNSFKPLLTAKPYRDLLTVDYLFAWLVTIVVTAVLVVPYTILPTLSLLLLVPFIFLVILLFYHGIFSAALFSTALTPS
jgi:hypothetical protein